MTKERDTLLYQFLEAAVFNPKQAKAMLRRHPDLIKRKTSVGETALHYVIVEDSPTGAEFLIGQGSDINTTNNFGDTPLMDAAYLGYTRMVKLLLDHGADLSVRNPDQETAFHKAAHAGSIPVMKLLLDHGADMHAVNDLGESVLDLAPARLKDKVAALLNS